VSNQDGLIALGAEVYGVSEDEMERWLVDNGIIAPAGFRDDPRMLAA
jgi:hypothetical protein